MNETKYCVGDFCKHWNSDNVYKIMNIVYDRIDLRNIHDSLTNLSVDWHILHRSYEMCDEKGNLIYKSKNKKENMEKETTKPELQKIKINSTVDAILVSPKMHGTMALVDLITLKRIASRMSSSSFKDIKEHFCKGLMDSENLEQYIGIMKEEILFHESVNLIKTIEVPVEKENEEDVMPSIH